MIFSSLVSSRPGVVTTPPPPKTIYHLWEIKGFTTRELEKKLCQARDSPTIRGNRPLPASSSLGAVWTLKMVCSGTPGPSSIQHPERKIQVWLSLLNCKLVSKYPGSPRPNKEWSAVPYYQWAKFGQTGLPGNICFQATKNVFLLAFLFRCILWVEREFARQNPCDWLTTTSDLQTRSWLPRSLDFKVPTWGLGGNWGGHYSW